MTEIRRTSGMDSPMEALFSWTATPRSCPEESIDIKRKSDDSGYVTPCSSQRFDSVSETPDSYSDTGFVSSSGVELCTPYTKSQEVSKKKVFITCSSNGPIKESEYNLASPLGEIDSYTEFLYGDTSLYNDPLRLKFAETDINLPHTPANKVLQEGLDVSEETKKIELSFTEEAMDIDFTPSRSKVGTPQFTFQKKKASSWDRKYFCNERQYQRRKVFIGLEKLDIMSHLGVKKNESLVVSRILDYLGDSDISSMTMVSRSWKKLCLNDPKTKIRWLKYTSDRKERKENLGVFQNSKLKNKALTPLVDRNHSTPLKSHQPTSPPVSPTKVRFYLFQKEAKKLKSDEILMRCPRCSHPSVCSPAEGMASCVKLDCLNKFCTVCLASYHRDRPCDGYLTPCNTTPTKRRATIIGSQESKKNLRRL